MESEFLGKHVFHHMDSVRPGIRLRETVQNVWGNVRQYSNLAVGEWAGNTDGYAAIRHGCLSWNYGLDGHTACADGQRQCDSVCGENHPDHSGAEVLPLSVPSVVQFLTGGRLV